MTRAVLAILACAVLAGCCCPSRCDPPAQPRAPAAPAAGGSHPGERVCGAGYCVPCDSTGKACDPDALRHQRQYPRWVYPEAWGDCHDGKCAK